MDRHPDILDLETLRTGEGRDDDARHVDACAECRRTLAELGGLAAALKSPHGDAPAIPAEIEARILWHANKQALAARRQQRAGIWWRRSRIAAAAAVLIAGASILGVETRRLPPAQQQVASAPVDTDFNRDGRLDVLDAFALARSVHGQAPDEAADVNGDGVVDQHDVDAVALRAVALGNA